LSHLVAHAARQREELEAVPFDAPDLPTPYGHDGSWPSFLAFVRREHQRTP
jgi:hypothetical protein